jgi:Flp pilus assembly protein TadD
VIVQDGGSMTAADLRLRIHEIALLIERLPVEPGDAAPGALVPLFHILQDGSADARSTAEAKIWAIWCAHEDPDLAAAMEDAIAALNGGDLDVAEVILDELVQVRPGWAETWNKRATLYFFMDRDAESASDIRRTLELEPRHFGALCGFAQIADRNGDAHAARIALERALMIHPGLPGIPSAIEQLSQRHNESLH